MVVPSSAEWQKKSSPLSPFDEPKGQRSTGMDRKLPRDLPLLDPWVTMESVPAGQGVLLASRAVEHATREGQMFKTVEAGAWYRIHFGGENVFAKILERRGRRYTFQYLRDDGGVATGEVGRSEICGRLGDHLVSSIESTMVAAQRPPENSPAPDIAPGEWRRFEHEGDTVPIAGRRGCPRRQGRAYPPSKPKR